MAGSALKRQVARAGDGLKLQANSGTEHSHHAAALKARWRTNLELHMSKSKVPVFQNPFDSQCHGFSFSQRHCAAALRQTLKCAQL
jgi:hypothetical protein